MPTRDDINSSIEKAIGGALDHRYWWAALEAEVKAVWGALPWISDSDLLHVAQTEAMMAYMENDPEAMGTRSVIQREYMKGVFAEDAINRHKRMMTLDSFIPKVLRNVCTLYNRKPERIFVKDGQPTADTFDRLYRDLKSNTAFQRAYKYATVLGQTALRSRFGPDGKLRSTRLTPNQYRLRSHPDFEDVIEEMWIPFYDMDDKGQPILRFKVWTADLWWITDYRGNPIDERGRPQTSAVDVAVPNPYGRIPYSFLTLRDSSGLYGSGLWEIVAMQVWNNTTMLANDRNHLFNSFSVILAVNLNMGSGHSFSPGQVVALDNIFASNNFPGEKVQPNLSTLELSGQYVEGEEFRRNRIKEFLRNNGLPSYYYDEGGQPPSGENLKVQERELKRITDEDRDPLSDFERDHAEATAIVHNRDRYVDQVDADGNAIKSVRVTLSKESALPEVLPDFSIDFTEEPYYISPKEDYELDKAQLADGTISLKYFYQKHSGDDSVKSDEEAAEKIRANRALASVLSESLSKKEEDNGGTARIPDGPAEGMGPEEGAGPAEEGGEEDPPGGTA